MSAVLAEILARAPDMLVPYFLVFLRIGAAMALLPAFGEMMLPLRVRLAAAIAFTLIAAPVVLGRTAGAGVGDSGSYTALGAGEVLTGLALGLALRLQIMALQVAASIAAQSTSLAQLLGEANVDPQPAIGVVLLLAALALGAELGLHVQVAAMFIRSYDFLGPGAVLGGGDLARWLVGAASTMSGFALALAAPFVAASLLYNLALGVINRAMPQLMVAFVGAPAITLGALVLLAITAPVMLGLWADALQSRLFDPFGTR